MKHQKVIWTSLWGSHHWCFICIKYSKHFL